ncbi:MAG: hypothetical protein IKZ33_05280 [Lentisphaeria bacterium]|nr:hypothetical protein [Lentisphaeria bacterium]
MRALCGIDLLNVITVGEDGKPNTELLDRLSDDPVLLVDTLYAVCKPDADAKGLTDEDFGRSFDGDSLISAAHALLDGIVDFFPEAKRRMFRKVLDASRRFEDATNQYLMKVMNSGDLDKALESQLQKLSEAFTNVPESAE